MTSWFASLNLTKRDVYELLMNKERLVNGTKQREPVQEWLLENDALYIAKLHRDCGAFKYSFNNFWTSDLYRFLDMKCREFFLEDFRG
jgi:hypothetical protein